MKRTLLIALGIGMGLAAAGFAGPAAAETAHHASHGGALMGLEYDGAEVAHLEMVVDPVKGAVSVYLVDAEAAEPVRVPQETLDLQVYLPNNSVPVTLTLSARENPVTGETAGDASEFAGQSDALKGASEFKATLVSLFVAGYEISEVDFGYPEGTH